MWLAFKALTWQVKLGILAGLLVILSALIGSTAYVSYQKGLNVSQVEILKYQNKLKTLAAEKAKVQTKIDVKYVTQYVDRVAYIDRVQYVNRDVIRDNVIPQFKLSKGWIYAYNQTVQGLPVDATLASNSSPASVSDVDALADTIVPNIGVGLRNKEKLDKLQAWARETSNAR